MYKTLFVSLSFICPLLALSQRIPLPKNYTVVDTVSGDLNKDNIKELVVAYNTKTATEEYENLPRELVIYKLQNGNWTVWKKSQQALLGSQDGGMMGDPYAGMEIKNNVLQVSHYGGSSWKWGYTDKYRYQKSDFYLIGYSSEGGKMCEEWTDLDFNLSTGLLTVEKKYNDCGEEQDQEEKTSETESETIYKKGLKITLEKRNSREIKIVTPKYKFDIYVATKND